MPLLKEKSFS